MTPLEAAVFLVVYSILGSIALWSVLTYWCAVRDLPDGTDDQQADRDGCPECDDGALRVADGIFAECDNCDAAVERREAGI